jgi:UDP-N-acetylglucosamine 3-dehydrogenase
MIRVAVVGVSQVGKAHCEVYQKNPNTILVAVCSRNEQRVKEAAETLGVKGYTNLQDLLTHEKIDLVDVTTGGIEKGSQHYEPTMMAIAAGKDVLVEKPISNHLGEARQMVKFAKAKGVRLCCNLNHRFTDVARKGKEIVDQGKIGEPLFMNMKLTVGNSSDETEWIQLRELAPHSIDMMRFMFGDIRRVQCFLTKPTYRTSWSTSSINVEFVSGAIGHLTGSYDMSLRHPIEWCEVAGTAGRFVIDNIYEGFTFYPHQSDELLVLRNSIFMGMQKFEDTYFRRINRMIEQIMIGELPEMMEASGEDALAAQEVIEAAILSFKSGGIPIDVTAQ